MALPSNISYTKITGRFLLAKTDTISDPDQFPDGVPMAGLQITLTPEISPMRVKTVNSVPPAIIMLTPITATTNADGDVVSADGTLGISVISSNDPDISPTNWTYRAKIAGTGFSELQFSFVAYSGATLDLTTMVPLPPNPGAEIVLWQQVLATVNQSVATAEVAADEAEAFANAAEAAADSLIDAIEEERYVAPGGSTGQIYSKLSNTDYDAGWVDAPEGGTGGEVPDGVVAYRGVWSATPTEAYVVPDLVSHNGQVYMLTGATGTETPGTGTNWRIITEQTAQYSSSYAGVLVANAGTFRLYNDTGRTQTILKVRASVGIAPVGREALFDVNLDGSTIFTTQANRPSIQPSAYTGVSPAPDITAWPDGSYITIDIDQTGTTAAGGDLTISVIVRG